MDDEQKKKLEGLRKINNYKEIAERRQRKLSTGRLADMISDYEKGPIEGKSLKEYPWKENNEYAEGGYVGGEPDMRDLLEQILAVMESQNAEIKALKAAINASEEKTAFDSFMERQGSKFASVEEAMRLISGNDDPVHSVFEMSTEASEDEGYDENNFVESILAGTLEKLEKLKGMVPPEAQSALAEAEANIQEAAAEAAEPESVEEISNPAPEDWSEEDLEKEKLEGHKLFE